MAQDEYYEAADRAIKRMDRDNLKAFTQLKATDFEKASVVRTILGLYRKQKRKARKEYLRIGLEAYLLGLIFTEEDIPEREAQKMADKAITGEWIDSVLDETDFVTLYRFNNEAERKAQRLIEGLAAASDDEYTENAGRAARITRNDLIDQALRQWTKQLAQYAINVTDYAMIQAYEDAGIEEAEWQDAGDQKVCSECHSRNGQVYRLDEIPPKHQNCRCRIKPVIR